MMSKEFSRLTTILLCISFLCHCVSSERLPASLLEANVNNSDDNTIADSIWSPPLSQMDSSELSVEDNESSELSQLLSKLVARYNEHDQHNRPSASSSPVRRANFWKRANFWRKRANFWRRDLDSQEYEQGM